MSKLKIAKPLFGATTANKAIMMSNAVDLRKHPLDKIESVITSYNRYQTAQHIVGLIHPDLAVQNQVPLKLYNEVPIPTASIGFHEQLQFKTSTQVLS